MKLNKQITGTNTLSQPRIRRIWYIPEKNVYYLTFQFDIRESEIEVCNWAINSLGLEYSNFKMIISRFDAVLKKDEKKGELLTMPVSSIHRLA